ncbi:hypothetical protein [Aureimonas glaciei]|jgi:hypothetical protein|uniref:Uncharacterized protein n=1 Tax=Aureimonas glaciei TaxID=1776957 RepID=A0A916XXZ5_9HYPH|nr:hypothetical protein [Aureimonas glaciei]GGD18579.1 hypothetical protein GCM10011335_21810 [Aureimonas glaciei]
MINALRGASLLAIFVVLPLVGCAPLMRPEGPSKVAQRAPIDSGPSTQRRGPDGYPLLGAFPSSAAPQLADAEVNAERSGLQGAQAGQGTEGATADADYARQLAEANALRLKTRQDVDAAVATGGPDGDTGTN